MNTAGNADNADEEIKVSDDDSVKEQKKSAERIELRTSYNFKAEKKVKKDVMKIKVEEIDFVQPEQQTGSTPNRKLVFQKLGESWR